MDKNGTLLHMPQWARAHLLLGMSPKLRHSYSTFQRWCYGSVLNERDILIDRLTFNQAKALAEGRDIQLSNEVVPYDPSLLHKYRRDNFLFMDTIVSVYDRRRGPTQKLRGKIAEVLPQRMLEILADDRRKIERAAECLYLPSSNQFSA